MSHIREDMSELQQIVAELKIINAKAKELRNRKKEIEAQILIYLDESDTPGIKFNELIVKRAERVSHIRLKKKEKQENVIKTLEESGVEDAEEVYKAILAAGLGEQETKSKLSIKITVPELF